MPISGKCSVCGKPCSPWERNADGTYLHTTCAMTVSTWPEKKEEKK